MPARLRRHSSPGSTSRTPAICTVEETSEVGVDGTDARLQRQTCGYNAWEVVAFDGDRVYLIYWLERAVAWPRAIWLIFEQVLATFRFG